MAGGEQQTGCTFAGCYALLVFILFCGSLTIAVLGGGGDSPALGKTPSFSNNTGGTSGKLTTTIEGTVSELKVGKKTIKMPATKGKSAQEEYLSGMSFSSECNSTEEKWYITMRWPYVKWAWSAYTDSGKYRGITKSVDSRTLATKPLYAKKRIKVYNPRTKKTVVTAICESGPAPWTGSSWAAKHGNKANPLAPYWQGYFQFDPPEADGRVAGLSPAAFDAIGASRKTTLEYGFAVDQSTPLGLVK